MSEREKEKVNETRSNLVHGLNRRSFAEAVRTSESDRKEVKKVHVNFDDDGNLVIPTEVADEGKKLWANTLVGYIVGRRLPLDVINRTVRSLWDRKGLLDVCSVGPGVFLMRFSSDESLDVILERSDWHIVGIPLMLCKWSPGFSYKSLEPKLLPMWIRLKNVPIEFFHWRGIEYIASGIGRPLRIDARSFSRGSVGNARVQIEFDASRELMKSVKMIDADAKVATVDIDYEFRPPHCNMCCTFGHAVDRCPHNPKTCLPLGRLDERNGKRVPRGKGRAEKNTVNQIMPQKQSNEVIKRSENTFSILETADADVENRDIEIVATTVEQERAEGVRAIVGIEVTDDHIPSIEAGEITGYAAAGTSLIDRDVEEGELEAERSTPNDKGKSPTQMTNSSESRRTCAKEASLSTFSEMMSGMRSSDEDDFSPSPKSKKKGKGKSAKKTMASRQVTLRKARGPSR